jgi:mono/diheme cytochrome c family protein
MLWSVVLSLALILSACGALGSDEPKSVREVEIVPLPTETRAPTLSPTEAQLATELPGATPSDIAPSEAAPTDAAPAGELDLASADYDQGFTLYTTECARCHGAQDGVGPGLANMRDNAPNRVAGLSAADYVYQSIVDPGAYVVEGYSNEMPSTFATDFSPQQVANLVKFILEFDPATMMGAAQAQSQTQSQSQSQPPAPADLGTQETPVAGVIDTGETLTVRGRLLQGTADGDPIPPNLPLELRVFDAHSNQVGVYDTTTADDNSFEFDDVPRAAGHMYAILANYAGVAQSAQIAPIQGDEDDLSKDIMLYERTTDTSTIAITWALMQINYAPIEAHGVEVWLHLQMANTGDKIVTTDETAGPNNWFVSSRLELPVNAFGIQPMQSEKSQRYTVETVNNIPVVKDTWPLRPGQVQTITIAYYLPYDDGAVVDQAFGYPVVDGAVLLPNDTVDFRSDQFDPQGIWCCRATGSGIGFDELQPDETINPDKDFALLRAHTLLTPTGASDHLIFELIGRPTRTIDPVTSRSSSSGSGTNPLFIALLVAGVGMIGLAGAMWWRQRDAVSAPPVLAWNPPDASAGKAGLLKAIATLDDAYEAGHVDETIYRERRAILSERLLPLLDEE